jgi:peroxiredoxin
METLRPRELLRFRGVAFLGLKATRRIHSGLRIQAHPQSLVSKEFCIASNRYIIKSTVRLRPIAAALVLCAALSTTDCNQYSSTVKASVKAEHDRRPAPDFNLKDADGKAVKLSDYKGKVVLLNFWATWCGPCKIEIPWFMDFEQTYKDKNFAVLGVSLDEDGWDSVKPYIEQKKINYRVMIGTEQVAQMYGEVDSLPTTFMIDREGRVAAVHIGLVSKSDYIHDIVDLLGAPQPESPVNRGSLLVRPAVLRTK